MTEMLMRIGSSFFDFRGKYESLPVSWLRREFSGAKCIVVGRAAPEFSALDDSWISLPGCRFNDPQTMVGDLAALIDRASPDFRRAALCVTDLDVADLLLAETELIEAVARLCPYLALPTHRNADSDIVFWGRGFSYPERNELHIWRWIESDPIAAFLAVKCPTGDSGVPTFLTFELLGNGDQNKDVQLEINGRKEIVSVSGKRKFTTQIQPGDLVEIAIASSNAPLIAADGRKLGIGIANLSIRQLDGTALLEPGLAYSEPSHKSEITCRQIIHYAGFSNIRSRWSYPGGLFVDQAGIQTEGTPSIGLTSASRETLFRSTRPSGDPECWLLASWYRD